MTLQSSDTALFNTKIKKYPDGSQTIIYCDYPIFRDPYAEKHSSDLPYIPTDENLCFLPAPDVTSPSYSLRHKHVPEVRSSPVNDKIYLGNIKRAKDKIFDIVMCNKWDYFFTGTFNDKIVGENTASNLLKPLQNWLRNMSYRYGLKYLLVAEYSPLNHRIHFHGLMNSALDMVDSGTRLCVGHSKPIKLSTVKRLHIPDTDARIVYNIPSWRFGFSTAIPVTGEPIQLARYITKYITKDCEKIFGNFYWSSRNIIRDPEIILCHTDDFESISLQEHYIKGCNFKLKYDCYFKK